MSCILTYVWTTVSTATFSIRTGTQKLSSALKTVFSEIVALKTVFSISVPTDAHALQYLRSILSRALEHQRSSVSAYLSDCDGILPGEGMASSVGD